MGLFVTRQPPHLAWLTTLSNPIMHSKKGPQAPCITHVHDTYQ